MNQKIIKKYSNTNLDILASDL